MIFNFCHYGALLGLALAPTLLAKDSTSAAVSRSLNLTAARIGGCDSPSHFCLLKNKVMKTELNLIGTVLFGTPIK
jgi:hypothetical protein